MLALPVTLLALAMAVWAADQSAENKSEEPDSFDVEPPILKQNLSDEPLPNGDLARLEKQLERAKQNAAGAERLCKIGVLAKMEVEQRLLKVIRCESDLANARVARAKEELAEKESQLATAEITRDELESMKTALAQLTEAAQAATAKRERAELESAEANLRRQQKLLKLGIGQKSDVTRAEEKLAELKATKQSMKSRESPIEWAMRRHRRPTIRLCARYRRWRCAFPYFSIPPPSRPYVIRLHPHRRAGHRAFRL